MTSQDQPEAEPESKRSHENVIEIDAPPQDVWRALSEGEELARWFAVQAEVAPGEGGSWKVSWDESPVQTYALIAAWEPLRRLRLVPDPAAGAPSRIAEEFEIEALEGGRCRLRIVASGFSTDAAWDGEFEGTKNGWAVFLRNLRFYLEHQRGLACASAGIPWRSTLTRARAFEQVFGSGGVLDCEGQARLEGHALSLRARWGETIEATVDMARGDAMLGLVIGDMLLRAEFVEMRSGLFIHVMLLAWGDARERMADLHARIAAALAEVLPQPPTLSSDA
jgi:uncharacterized protein YndB with AHSA1/START domain